MPTNSTATGEAGTITRETSVGRARSAATRSSFNPFEERLHIAGTLVVSLVLGGFAVLAL